MFSRLLFLALFVTQLSAVNPPLSAVPAVTLETGEINGAKFTLARPAHWNARVLLLAHGLRDADRPLVADLFPEHLAYRTKKSISRKRPIHLDSG